MCTLAMPSSLMGSNSKNNKICKCMKFIIWTQLLPPHPKSLSEVHDITITLWILVVRGLWQLVILQLHVHSFADQYIHSQYNNIQACRQVGACMGLPKFRVYASQAKSVLKPMIRMIHIYMSIYTMHWKKLGLHSKDATSTSMHMRTADTQLASPIAHCKNWWVNYFNLFFVVLVALIWSTLVIKNTKIHSPAC